MMLEIVVHPSPCVGDTQEDLVHTPQLPWLIQAVRRAGDYEGLTESTAIVQALDAYGPATWSTLATCGALDPASVEATRAACVYDGMHEAFYPTALCSTEAGLEISTPTGLSPGELVHHNERAALALSQGKFSVSKAARRALGEGYSGNLRIGQGVSVLAMMEMALTNGTRLLGWGWLWHANNLPDKPSAL